MDCNELSKIRAAAGRKGGLAKAKNRRARTLHIERSDQAEGNSIAESIKRLESRANELSDKLDMLIDRLTTQSNDHQIKNSAKRTIKTVATIDSKTAKDNFFKGIAKANGHKNGDGGAFAAIVKANRELDDLAKLSKS